MERVFSSDPDLLKAVNAVVQRYPDTRAVLERVIHHFQHDESDHKDSRPHKRLKIEDASPEAVSNKTNHKVKDVSEHYTSSGPLLAIKDLSFSMPCRKKLTLNIHEDFMAATHAESDTQQMLTVYKDISCIVVLPVPEKAVKQYNFCIFPRDSDQNTLFTVPDARPTNASGPAMTGSHTDSYKSLLIKSLESKAKKHGFLITQPNTADFVSTIPQAHRKTEPAVHLLAHRGSKEGYLFFVPNGLVWGFKRPLLFIPIQDIASVSYNDILQRTFNLTITYKRKSDEGEQEEEELEFSMIDAAEYDGVDKFVKKYRLNDASLSEQRRAKVSVQEDKHPSNRSELEAAAEQAQQDGDGASDDDDDQEDGDFRDDVSHGGSTLASDESDEDEDDDGDKSIDLDQDSEAESGAEDEED